MHKIKGWAFWGIGKSVIGCHGYKGWYYRQWNQVARLWVMSAIIQWTSDLPGARHHVVEAYHGEHPGRGWIIAEYKKNSSFRTIATHRRSNPYTSLTMLWSTALWMIFPCACGIRVLLLFWLTSWAISTMSIKRQGKTKNNKSKKKWNGQT